MRLSQIIMEAVPKDARIHHLEDMVIWSGLEGAKEAIEILRKIGQSTDDVSIKWDGAPAVIFGRNEAGEFVMTDKRGFNDKDRGGHPTTPEGIAHMYLNRGKIEVTPEREAFANAMSRVFAVVEKAVPKSFRGWLFGDLMWRETPALVNNHYVFKPNLVSYSVDATSEIGRKISQSTVGVTVHQYIDLEGVKSMAHVRDLKQGELVVLPPVSPVHTPEINSTLLDHATGVVAKATHIDELINDDTLRALKLSDFKQVLYTYVNAKVRQRALTGLASGFFEWLETSRVSAPKQDRMKQHIEAHGEAFNEMFKVFELIMKAKNDVIKQFDNQEADITSTINDQPGGEGYVYGTGHAKLVDRGAFSVANFEKGDAMKKPKSESTDLQLVNTLTESRLFRNKKIASEVNVDEAAELVFVYFMLLNIFNKDYDFAPLAAEYANRTSAFANFDTFRTSGTDLYIAINRLIGKDQSYDDERDSIAIDRVNLNKAEVKRYLQHIGNNKSEASFEQRMLFKFQRDLNVQDGMLKSMRRLVGDWDNLNFNQRALVVTRLTQYTRNKARRSEMLEPLLALQKRGQYVVKDNKQQASKIEKIWANPIVKVAAAGALIYGAGKLGKHLGKSSYTTGRDLSNRFPSTKK